MLARRPAIRLAAALALALAAPATVWAQPAPTAVEAPTQSPSPRVEGATERLEAAQADLDAVSAELARLRGEMYGVAADELAELERRERTLQSRKDSLAQLVGRRERELADRVAEEAETREEPADEASATPDSPTGIVLAPSMTTAPAPAAGDPTTLPPAGVPAPGALPVAAPAAAVPVTAATGTPDAARIDGYLASKLSPLAGLGAVFVAESRRVGLDPRFLVAIAGSETSFGTYGPSQRIHNPFGLGPGMTFPSWSDAIRYAANNLAGRLYRGDGRVTIAAIQQRWAPHGAANDPTNLNSNWTRNVSMYYAELGGDPAAPVFIGVAAPAAYPAVPYAPATVVAATPANTGPDAAQQALTLLGTPYAAPGEEGGIDDAGLVQTVYAASGVTVAADPAAQAEYGTAVEPRDMRAGDVVLFADDTGAVTHVGLYVGGGQFVHAPGPGQVVSLASLYDARWASLWAGARRY